MLLKLKHLLPFSRQISISCLKTFLFVQAIGYLFFPGTDAYPKNHEIAIKSINQLKMAILSSCNVTPGASELMAKHLKGAVFIKKK
ncbi:MAG: hypothetical protein CFH06_01173 [Alphaproteobacteria bacterium MarineAlpha3_Bin5]|nr:MAG: hypothetical protein CFH06_01173 [Alphaproteobacteria bacterium MarineAlpha3_Bin5]